MFGQSDNVGPPVFNRFDQFQDQAVSNIVADFDANPNGRFLLVIPTGGGKTITAAKAINQLYRLRTLDPERDRVLWTAHRNELLLQAESAFRLFVKKFPDLPSFASCVDFRMISRAAANLTRDFPHVRLIVIDEAHHAALKNVNYGPLFESPDIGILGLTATPSRHDGAPLEFDRESFSIGFPDLVKLGIVLKPEVRTVRGGHFNIQSIDDDSDLNQLDTLAARGGIAVF